MTNGAEMTGTTTYLAVQGDGRSYNRITVTEADQDRLFDLISDFFDAGVERFGSVDAFHLAMRWDYALRHDGAEPPYRDSSMPSVPTCYVEKS